MIGLAVMSAAVPAMAAIGFAKRGVANRVGIAVLAAEARFSLLDACPGPLVALVIACGAAREGVENDRSSRP